MTMGEGRLTGSTLLDASLSRLAPLDVDAMTGARELLDSLTKPRGSLGRLEDLIVQLAGITGEVRPRGVPRSMLVAAADHGVAAHGVSAYPQEVTAQMVTNFLSGGAAIAVLAREARARLVIADLGLANVLPAVPKDAGAARYEARAIRAGTADMTIGPSMSREEALRAIDVGIELATVEVDAGAHILVVGEMGIGNTTAAAALVAVLTGRPVSQVPGIGTGIGNEGWRHKVEVIERAIAVNRPPISDPLAVLAAVGGLEIAALVGVIVAGAARRVPVLLDGFVTGAAALVADQLARSIGPVPLSGRVIAGHCSVEPGHQIVLRWLGLEPLLTLGLRLGEASGGALALGLVDAAIALRDGMATFASAQVASKKTEVDGRPD